MSVFTGRAQVPEPPALADIPGAKAIRMALALTVENDALKRTERELTAAREELHNAILAAQSVAETALYKYSVAKQRNPYSTDLPEILYNALFDLDRRLDEGLVSAGLPPTRGTT
jgi:hypothetical protein